MSVELLTVVEGHVVALPVCLAINRVLQRIDCLIICVFLALQRVDSSLIGIDGVSLGVNDSLIGINGLLLLVTLLSESVVVFLSLADIIIQHVSHYDQRDDLCEQDKPKNAARDPWRLLGVIVALAHF